MCSGGIQLTGWKGSDIIRRKNQADPVLMKFQFVPYVNDEVKNYDFIR